MTHHEHGEGAEIEREELEELRDQVHLSRKNWRRHLWVFAGHTCLFLGLVGILLPVVPTTPFLLLTATCYARGSETFYIWLLTNRYFGHYIRDWRENRGISIPLKIWITFVLVVVMGASAYFFVPLVPVRVLLLAIGTGVSIYIWRLPTKRGSPTEE